MQTWGTQKELNFIRDLGRGKYSSHLGVRRCTRADLLSRYITATKLRQNWGDINRAEAVGFAREILRQYQRLGSNA
jgi:hypothetical protein